MPLSGINNEDELDFPRHVKDSVTVLPFKSGGTTQLAVAATPEDLVLVTALRRFENQARIAEGTHTGGNNSATTLTDSTADFDNWGVEVGDRVVNTTDGSAVWQVDSVDSATQLTVSLVTTGGVDDDFDTNDVYQISKDVSHTASRAAEIRVLRLATDLECYVQIDGEASAASHLYHLRAGDAINEEGIRVVSRISILNVVAGEQPSVRFAVWGL